MVTHEQSLVKTSESILSTNCVLRNTYILLGLTLIFSSIMAGWAMTINATPLNPFLTIICYFALLFLTTSLRNSPWGLVAVFALTGFLGYTIGPILNMYVNVFSNGSQMIMMALGATGLIFFTLSAYAVTTKKDFNYLGAFIFVAILTAFIGSVVAVLFNLPTLSLLVSGAFVLISSGMILFQTSMIINGGERNYIMATINLYVALLNLFLSLLRIFAAFSGDRN